MIRAGWQYCGMSSAAQFLRGIDMLMALLCLVNLALITDSLASHRLPASLPPSAASAYLSCAIYCLFDLVTLLVILIVRSVPRLCRAAGNESGAATCCGLQLAVQLVLLLPRTLIVLSLLSTVLRSRVLLLGDAVHTVLYLSSALVLFIYSCAILVLDCQHLQRWTASTMAPRSLDSTDEVRILGMSVFGGPLWTTEYSTSTRSRGLTELEIDRVTTLTTFTSAAATTDKTAEDGVDEKKAAEAVQVETTTVVVQDASEQQLSVMASEENKEAVVVDPQHYPYSPAPPPTPGPHEPATQLTVSNTMHSLPRLLRCRLLIAHCCQHCVCSAVPGVFGGAASR